MEKRWKVRLQRFYFSFIIVSLLVPVVNAQTGVGKLSGKIRYAATREDINRDNILLVSTQSGAASDINGDYFILNITPDTYTDTDSYADMHLNLSKMFVS